MPHSGQPLPAGSNFQGACHASENAFFCSCVVREQDFGELSRAAETPVLPCSHTSRAGRKPTSFCRCAAGARAELNWSNLHAGRVCSRTPKRSCRGGEIKGWLNTSAFSFSNFEKSILDRSDRPESTSSPPRGRFSASVSGRTASRALASEPLIRKRIRRSEPMPRPRALPGGFARAWRSGKRRS